MPTSLQVPVDVSLLSHVIAAVCRSSGLSPEDAQDFSQHVHLTLLERDYAPLHRYAGRSSLRTFLHAVVRNQLLDWRNRRYGKWRPCEAARRSGPAAVDLDRLISRDGLPVDDAIAMVAMRPGAPDVRRLRALADGLQVRSRPRPVAIDDIDALGWVYFDDPIEARHAAEERRARLVRLRDACRALPADDRLLLHLRFGRGLTVPAIAALRGEPAKPLYRRVDRILNTLRRALADERGGAHRGPISTSGSRRGVAASLAS